MMTIEEAVLEKLREMSPEKQQELLNFAEFLIQDVQAESDRPAIDWQHDPAVGMWKDRGDMQDSASWVRQIREQNRYGDAASSS